jgi:putative ABC transport system substrate-binding protein
MRRRDFIKVIGSGAAVWPFAARAQRPAVPVIGYLAAGSSKAEAPLVAVFVKGVGEAGYEDGKTIQIEYRWAENQYDRLPSMAADLVRRQVAVIAATTTPAIRAAKAATATIPIVFTTIADPVQIGFVTRLNRPGGNVTGATMLKKTFGNAARSCAFGDCHRSAHKPDQSQRRDPGENHAGGSSQARSTDPCAKCQRRTGF